MLITFGCTTSSRKISEKTIAHFSFEDLGVPEALHFIDEEYHLFYKNIGNDSVDGIGRLTSDDLINWKNGPCNLEFVIDENFRATSIIRNWNSDEETIQAYVLKNDELVVFLSNDFGVTWQIWDEEIFIDATLESVNNLKVVWNEDVQKWVMVLLKDYEVEFYASENLKNWEFQSLFDAEPAVKKGDWTDVDFFPIEYPETLEIKWCLAISTNEGAANYGLGTQYFVGDFADLQFHTEDDVKWMDAGTDLYSPVVLSDYLLLNKTPISIAKIDKNNSITLPRSLSLIRKFNEFFIASNPLEEINQIQHKTKQIAGQEFVGELNIKQKQHLPIEINLLFDLNNRKYLDFAEVFGLILENEKEEKLIIGYHNLRRYFFISFNNEIVYAPCIIDQPEIEIKLFIDRTTVELFAMDGFVSMTKYFVSEEILNQLKLFTEGGKIILKETSITQLDV